MKNLVIRIHVLKIFQSQMYLVSSTVCKPKQRFINNVPMLSCVCRALPLIFVRKQICFGFVSHVAKNT